MSHLFVFETQSYILDNCAVPYPYPPQGRLMEISRGRGVSKDQFLKGKYDAKIEFPGWTGGFKLKSIQ